MLSTLLLVCVSILPATARISVANIPEAHCSFDFPEIPNGDIHLKIKPENVKNGTVKATLPVGHLVPLKCKIGHKLKYPEFNGIECGSDGQWKVLNSCYPAHICGDLPSLKNGQIVKGNTSLTEYLIKCNEGYELFGKTDVVTCEKTNKKWMAFGSCLKPKTFRKVCGHPPNLANARIGEPANRREVYPGQKVVFYCDIGYETRNGSSQGILICDSKATWRIINTCHPVIKTPKVVLIDDEPAQEGCSEMPTLVDGVIAANESEHGNWTVGTVLHVTCNGGLKELKKGVVKCLKSGQWEVHSKCSNVSEHSLRHGEITDLCKGSPASSMKLYLAIRSDNSADLEKIIKGYQSDSKEPDMNGILPVMLAIRYRKSKAAVMLLEYINKADSSIDEMHEHLLFEAVKHNLPEVARAVIKLGAKVHMKNCNGFTPLQVAVMENKADIVREVINAPQINQEDLNLALSLAVEMASVDCVQLLLESKADPNYPRGESELRPLHLAMMSRCDGCVELLLQYNADALVRDKVFSATPLSYGVYFQFNEMLGDLLDASEGVDMYQTGLFGMEPLELAKAYGYNNTEKYLMESMISQRLVTFKAKCPCELKAKDIRSEISQSCLLDFYESKYAKYTCDNNGRQCPCGVGLSSYFRECLASQKKEYGCDLED